MPGPGLSDLEMEEVPQVGNWIVGQKDGKPFYFNTITGESTRCPPVGQVLPNVGGADTFGRSKKRPRVTAPAATMKSLMHDLKGSLDVDKDPLNWVVGQQHGQQTFFNTKTKESTVTPPRALRHDAGVLPTASFAELAPSPALIVEPLVGKVEDGEKAGGMSALMDDMDALELDKLLNCFGDDTDTDHLPMGAIGAIDAIEMSSMLLPPHALPPQPRQPPEPCQPQPQLQPCQPQQPQPQPCQPQMRQPPTRPPIRQPELALFLQQQAQQHQQLAQQHLLAQQQQEQQRQRRRQQQAALPRSACKGTAATARAPARKGPMTKAEKAEEKKRRNRIAANKSRDKRLAETAALKQQVATLTEESNLVKQRLAASNAENHMLREQMAFLRGLLKDAFPAAVLPASPPQPAGSAASLAAMAAP